MGSLGGDEQLGRLNGRIFARPRDVNRRSVIFHNIYTSLKKKYNITHTTHMPRLYSFPEF